MTEVVSAKEMQQIGKIIKELNSLALLLETETVREGFFPVIIENNTYTGLLTDKQLILTQTHPRVNYGNSVLIPFEKIQDNSLNWNRNRQFLYQVLASIAVIPIMAILVLFITHLSMNLGEIFFGIPLVEILMYLVIIIECIMIPPQLYHYIKGENTIQIVIPGKTLKVRRKFKALFRQEDIKFFRLLGGISNYLGSKNTIEDLHVLLSKYIKVM